MITRLSVIFLLGAAVAVANISVTSAAEPPITSVAVSPDGKSVIATSQAGIHQYGWPSLERVATVKSHSPNLHHLAFSPDGNRIAVAGGTPSETGTVEILSWPELKPLRQLNRHNDCVTNVVWINESTIASSSLDHEIILWEIPDSVDGAKVLRTLKGHSRGVTSLCYLPKNGILVSAGIDQSLRVWQLPAGKLIHSLSNHPLPVVDLALRPGGHALPMVASASEDRTVRLWQPTIGRMVRFARLASKPLAIKWNDDGSRIMAACENGNVVTIDPDTVEIIATQATTQSWPYAFAVHPSKSKIIGGPNGKLIAIE